MSAATENVNRELGHLHASRRFALPTPVCVGTLLPSITQLTALGGMTRGGQRATTAFGPFGALAPRAPVGTLFRLRQTLTTRFRYWHLADRLHRCSDVRFDPKRTVDWQENREAGSEACVLRGEFVRQQDTANQRNCLVTTPVVICGRPRSLPGPPIRYSDRMSVGSGRGF